MFKLLLVAVLVMGQGVEPPAPPKPTWYGNQDCVVGSFDLADVEIETPDPYYSVVRIGGQLDCGDGPLKRYGVSISVPTDTVAHVVKSMLESYSLTAPTRFRASVPTLFGNDLVLCLHPGPGRTLDCVRASAGAEGAVTVVGVPRDQWPALVIEEREEYHTQPQCNTCWTTEPV